MSLIESDVEAIYRDFGEPVSFGYPEPGDDFWVMMVRNQFGTGYFTDLDEWTSSFEDARKFASQDDILKWWVVAIQLIEEEYDLTEFPTEEIRGTEEMGEDGPTWTQGDPLGVTWKLGGVELFTIVHYSTEPQEGV